MPTKGCPQLYLHPQRHIWSVVHGDDFLSVAEKDQQRWLEQFLRSKFKVEDFEAIGPGAGQELSFLNRTVRFWAVVGFEVQPDPKLIERTVEELGLTTAKPVAASGVKDGGPAVSTGDDVLPRPERELYARAVGRVLYVSLDRYDIQYVTRLLTRVLVCPCKLDLHRLRHLVKFLLGTKEWAWVFAWQPTEEAAQLRGQSDSDWAQDHATRRSVSSGFVARGRHVLETWTQGQQLIALSSGEAEFYAAGSAAARLLYHVYLLRELGSTPRATLACDSPAARGVLQLSLIHI